MQKQIYKNVVFFEENFHIRIKESEKKMIERVVHKNQDVFMSDSHFVRCAIIRFLREGFDEKGRIKKNNHNLLEGRK